MLAAHLAWDLFLSFCAVWLWFNIPSESEHSGKDAPVLLIFATTVLLPWTALKAALCTRIYAHTANQLKTLYFQICVMQFIFNNVCFALEMTFYKSVLLNLGSDFHNESNFITFIGIFMQLYIYCLNIWSILEFTTYSRYWCTGGEGYETRI